MSDRTLSELIKRCQEHRVSTFHGLRYQNRKWQASVLRRIDRTYGHFILKDIRYVTVKEWHMDWLGPAKKISMGQALVATLRTLSTFGLTLLEDKECERISTVLRAMKVPHAPPRTTVMTADHIVLIRKVAIEQFRYSISFATALQFELILRQKDVIGEYVPHAEPGISEVLKAKDKWLRGLRWEEIDANMILTHVTSKKQKPLVIDLKMAPMVLEELGTSERSWLPSTGPLIISESTGFPYHAEDFRRKWRKIADLAGLPKEFRSQDLRASGISEARDGGADIEHVREAATHADIAQTRDYDRNAAKKIADVQEKRSQYRAKKVG